MKRDVFMVHFAASLALLSDSEVVTKRELRSLSRDLIVAIHGFEDATLMGDIQFINQLLPVLTPVNRKVARLFFTHFTGFHFDDKLGAFTKKSAKRGPEARAAAVKFIEDPMNNIWTWAEREITIEAKPFDPEKVKKYISGAIEKAVKDGKTRLDVLSAVFSGGFTPEDIIALMDTLGYDMKEVAPEQQQG